jgi:hypothetical protein
LVSLLFIGALSIKKVSKKNDNLTNNKKYTNEDKSMPASLSANKKMNQPTMIIDQNKKYEATLHTSVGDITISLNTQETPVTANNFLYLAQNKFYDQTIFHRVIDGFMIQGGDPRGDGTGGPGYQFADEEFSGNTLEELLPWLMLAQIPMVANFSLCTKTTAYNQIMSFTER